ncbi:unnamed protein product [[Actinomadura] parvosata subsp. kistnae]|nr:unnamed protein product [Actinomadura parvosata subsp. kistnae]
MLKALTWRCSSVALIRSSLGTCCFTYLDAAAHPARDLRLKPGRNR